MNKKAREMYGIPQEEASRVSKIVKKIVETTKAITSRKDTITAEQDAYDLVQRTGNLPPHLVPGSNS